MGGRTLTYLFLSSVVASQGQLLVSAKETLTYVPLQGPLKVFRLTVRIPRHSGVAGAATPGFYRGPRERHPSSEAEIQSCTSGWRSLGVAWIYFKIVYYWAAVPGS